MRTLILVGILVLMGGCASTPVKAPWADKYVGKTGYFLMPVSLKTAPKGAEYKQCEPATITGLNRHNRVIEVVFKQGEHTFSAMEHSYGAGLFWLGEDAQSVAALDHYFAAELYPDRTVKNGKDSFSSREKLCEGTVWTSMTNDEVVFVKGVPEKVNTTVMAGLKTEQYVYRKPGGGQFDREYFYIRNGKLTSWQR